MFEIKLYSLILSLQLLYSYCSANCTQYYDNQFEYLTLNNQIDCNVSASTILKPLNHFWVSLWYTFEELRISFETKFFRKALVFGKD